MNAYRITDWDNKYEVSPEGKPANEGTKRYRKTSLPFVRLKIFSESNGMAYRKLLRLAGKDTPAVFGLFCMFLEIAANRNRTYRGWLLDEQQKPLSADDLAFELGCENQFIENALKILADERLNWLKLSDFKTNSDSTVKLLYNETEQNVTKHNETKNQSYGLLTENTEHKSTKGGQDPADISLQKTSINVISSGGDKVAGVEKSRPVCHSERSEAQSRNLLRSFGCAQSLGLLTENGLRRISPLRSSRPVGTHSGRNDNLSTEQDTEKTPADIDLEKISKNLRNKPKHQIGNLSPSLNNVLSNARNSSLKNSSPSDSASACGQWDWPKAKERWSLAMQKYFPQNRFIPSDVTTFFEMIKYLYDKHSPMTDELFNKATDLAAQARAKPGIKNPLAYFVSRFKIDFGDFTK